MKFKVLDMSCQHCVKRIGGALKAINGVRDVKIDLQSKDVEVEGSVDKDIIIKAIKDAGYTADFIK